jgi:hypothetical protein
MQFRGQLRAPGTIRKIGKTLMEEEKELYRQHDKIRFQDSKEPSRTNTWNDAATDGADAETGSWSAHGGAQSASWTSNGQSEYGVISRTSTFTSYVASESAALSSYGPDEDSTPETFEQNGSVQFSALHVWETPGSEPLKRRRRSGAIKHS